MVKVGLVVLVLIAVAEGVILGLHHGDISGAKALITSDHMRRDMCASIKGELTSLKTSQGGKLAGEHAMGWLSALSASPLLVGCGTTYANIASEMKRAQDCYIESSDAACIADAADKVAAQLKE
jgi:hypothetical protein